MWHHKMNFFMLFKKSYFFFVTTSCYFKNKKCFDWTVYIRYLSNVTFGRFCNIIIVFPDSGNFRLYRCFRCKCIRFISLFLFSNTFSIKGPRGTKWAITCIKDLHSTAVAPGTVGTVPTVPQFGQKKIILRWKKDILC